MRERKYKAWDKKNKKWIKIAGIKFQGDDLLVWEWVKVKGLRVQEYYYLPEDFELIEWTGLKDKNGKDIYEGDIVKDRYNCKQKIIFKGGKFCFNKYYYEILTDPSLELEVIGNIYENPELLKRGEDK